jgi:type III pantothenate kinase
MRRAPGMSAATACGITNLYEQPAQLGADRWLALIGARSLCAGPLVVATAGTATTVDALDGQDRFLGGYILPGLRLMLEALARNTAGLPHARGQAADWPRNTDDAIHNACTDAQAALMERVRDQLGDGATLLLSGGAAAAISPRLRCAPPRGRQSGAARTAACGAVGERGRRGEMTTCRCGLAPLNGHRPCA